MGADAVPTRGRRRTQQAVEAAERRFVGRVVADGGIGPWRAAAELLLSPARATFARHGRLARSAVASLVVALADQPTRDRYWHVIDSQPDPGWPSFWLYVSRRALPPYRAEPLFLLAWSAWRLGDARLARAATDAALGEDLGHRGASLLLTMLRAGIGPTTLPLADRSATAAGGS